jgi:hypothetical protein
MITGGVTFSNFYVDNVSISDFTIPPPTFPYLSQEDPLWASLEYDSASAWAGIDKSGIERWGCALTSAAMMLQEYGVKDLSGNEMKPDFLNTWLKGQSDGYIGPGYVNWLAIARYAKGKATDGKSLEFTRSYDPSAMELPAILGLPGHFVVAHGEDATTWKINDPADETKTTLAKTTAIRSINRFTLSSTDLSYMLFSVNSGVSATLYRESGEEVDIDWSDEYLSDDVEGTASSTVQVGMLAKPPSGKYRLEVTRPNDQDSDVKIYLYDKLGSTTPQILPLTLPTTSFDIQYGSEVGEVRTVTEVDSTMPNFTLTTPTFEGWMTTNQTATFEYFDINMLDDYTHPTCEIGSEGLAQTCSILPNVCDKAGNCNTQSQVSNPADIDKTPPASFFILPPITNNWDGIVVGTASDNVSGVAKVELMITRPGEAEMSVVASGTENWSYTLSDLRDGEYIIKSRATDMAGNVESERSVVTLTLDRVAPGVPRILWARGWWNRIFVDWRSVGGASKYRVYYGSKRNQLNNISEVTESDWMSEALKQGQYYVAISAIDQAGNESQISKISKVEVHKKWDWRRLRFND